MLLKKEIALLGVLRARIDVLCLFARGLPECCDMYADCQERTKYLISDCNAHIGQTLTYCNGRIQQIFSDCNRRIEQMLAECDERIEQEKKKQRGGDTHGEKNC